MLVKTITTKQYRNAIKAAQDAIENIPARHNRKREHIYSEVLEREIKNAVKTRELKTVLMKQAIHFSSRNLGSKNYPDYVKDMECGTIKTISGSCKSVGYYTNMKPSLLVENLIFIWR